MRLRNGITIILTLMLGIMMVCSAVASARETASKPESHCSHETPVPPPQQNNVMQCCCDQSAIPVQELHAPFDRPTLEVLHPTEEALNLIHFAFDRTSVPFLKTGDHLAELSSLRL